MRISFSTTTKTIEFGSASLKRLVTPTGMRKKRPTANAIDRATVPHQAPPAISLSSSPSWAFAESARAS